MGDNNGTHPKDTTVSHDTRPQRWFSMASIGIIATTIVIKYIWPSPALHAISDLLTILLTSFISYVVSSHFAEKSARDHLRDLAESTGEHIFLLAGQIRQLADESESFKSDTSRSQFYIESLHSQLYKLASQAELSFHNTQRLAGFDISLPKLREEVRTVIEDGTKQESIACPRCQTICTTPLSTTPGKSRHINCNGCRLPFMVHRLPDSGIKTTFEEAIRIDCPNTPCTNNIIIKRRQNESGTVIRNCYDCYARIRFNLDTKQILGFEVEKPIPVTDFNTITNQTQCPYCSATVDIKGTKNSRGDILQYCPNCTKLLLVDK